MKLLIEAYDLNNCSNNSRLVWPLCRGSARCVRAARRQLARSQLFRHCSALFLSLPPPSIVPKINFYTFAYNLLTVPVHCAIVFLFEVLFWLSVKKFLFYKKFAKYLQSLLNIRKNLHLFSIMIIM